jgi:uncharacterized membrane protein
MTAQRTAFISTLALIVLCIAWEWFLAPLRPGGSWFILKAIPLVLVLPGLYRGDNYVMQASSMLILLYMTEGLVRILDPWPNVVLAVIEVALSLMIFLALLAHLRPLKKIARANKENK